MSIKKLILIMIIGIIILGASLANKNKRLNELIEKNTELEEVLITPPMGGVSDPVKVDLTEEEISGITIYGDNQEE